MTFGRFCLENSATPEERQRLAVYLAAMRLEQTFAMISNELRAVILSETGQNPRKTLTKR